MEAYTVDDSLTGIRVKTGNALVGTTGPIDAKERVEGSSTGIVVRAEATGTKGVAETGHIFGPIVNNSSTGISDED